MSFQSTRLGRMRASESQLRHKSALMTSISMIQPQTTQEGGKAANQPCKPGSPLPLPLQPEKSLSRPTPAQPTSRKP